MEIALVDRVAGPITAQMPCIVDARLALGQLGLLSIVRLASSFAIWVPSELREVLRNAQRHQTDAERLAPRVYCQGIRNLDRTEMATEIEAELAQWDRLPVDDELASVPLFYVGDRADESSMPPGTDRGVRGRFEQLQKGLELRVRSSNYDLPRSSILSSCFRDTAALCASLQPYRAFVLTRLESDGEDSPAICDYLDAWRVPVREAPADSELYFRRLSETLQWAGLAPLQWSGSKLAAVHIVVPGFTVLGGTDKGLDGDAVARMWGRASVVWHRV